MVSLSVVLEEVTSVSSNVPCCLANASAAAAEWNLCSRPFSSHALNSLLLERSCALADASWSLADALLAAPLTLAVPSPRAFRYQPLPCRGRALSASAFAVTASCSAFVALPACSRCLSGCRAASQPCASCSRCAFSLASFLRSCSASIFSQCLGSVVLQGRLF